jgi:hypothetical protein
MAVQSEDTAMNVARTTYRAVLVAAALSCLGYASVAHADRDDRGWHEERRWDGDRRDDRRWEGGRWDGRYRGEHHRRDPRWDDRRYRDDRRYWHDPRWVPPGHRRPPTYRPGYGYSPYWSPRPWNHYRPYPPRGYYGGGYYHRHPSHWSPPRHYWRDDGDVSLTIRIPF